MFIQTDCSDQSEKNWIMSGAIGWTSGVLMISLLLFFIAGCAGTKAIPPEKESPGEYISTQWGVQVELVALTAAGRMVDFRYRVLDTEKATPLFKRSTKPYLIHQVTQQTLVVPTTAKVGPLRNTGTPETGKVYWMFFGNPGVVKSGDVVDIVIGDAEFKNLVVQ